ncbi:Glucooligosaccharide oxidase [Podospora australis]|uniref:Glucooligosaccharide oxidase n=1 Tax=Podospora australis TaxID=1536484 RepID=A0AAN7ACW5_9PEZI|nr:Glucooligosaccharide oxidase [Podospora australis]
MASLLALTLLPLLLAGAQAATPGVQHIRGTSWPSPVALVQCLDTHHIPYRVTSSPDWAEYATTFNARLQYIPAAIALPNTTDHVSSAVMCASKTGFPVQPKSGGHSYASFSTGGRNGILMISLENFNSIKLDNKTGVAMVGGGVRLGNLAQGIWDQGRRALGHGTCPGVGIGGHFTHGGYGYSSRLLGLALDQIIALDVILANGSYVHTDSQSYPDIYYALRGAADSFGIVTTFYLQTSAAPETVINFSYSFPDALTSVSNAVATFKGVQKFSLNGSVVNRNIGFGITIAGNATGYTVHGTYFGSFASYNKTIAPALLGQIPFRPSNESTVQETDWITSLVQLGGAPNLTVPLHGYTERDNFYAKSVTTTEPFNDKALERFFLWAYTAGRGKNSPVDWFSIINLYGGPDSAIGRYNEEFAAYAGYDDLWVVQNYGSAPMNQQFPKAGLAFLDSLNGAMTSAMPEYAAYLNYIDPSYSREQAYRLYYGEELFKRLKELKKQLDPKDVFWNPQSIPIGSH